MSFSVFDTRNTRLFTGINSIAYFLSVHSLSDGLEEVTFLSLIVWVNYYFLLLIVLYNFLQSYLIIIRACPQNNITHILRYFNNFPMIPFN